MGDPDGMFRSMKPEEHLELNVSYRENAFQKCDEVTRRTRRLAKMVILMDMRCVVLEHRQTTLTNAFIAG